MHEGFIGVFDGELKEDSYSDIEERKISREADNGWLGITDKYWITAVVPPKDANFKSSFLYKDKYKANYILNKPVKINSSASANSEVRLFVAAKEVETVDGYAESEKIEKFDLTIDWGWFIFSLNPYFLQLTTYLKFQVILVSLSF